MNCPCDAGCICIAINIAGLRSMQPCPIAFAGLFRWNVGSVKQRPPSQGPWDLPTSSRNFDGTKTNKQQQQLKKPTTTTKKHITLAPRRTVGTKPSSHAGEGELCWSESPLCASLGLNSALSPDSSSPGGLFHFLHTEDLTAPIHLSGSSLGSPVCSISQRLWLPSPGISVSQSIALYTPTTTVLLMLWTVCFIFATSLFGRQQSPVLHFLH